MPNLNFAELILRFGIKYFTASDIFHFTTFTNRVEHSWDVILPYLV